MKSKEKITKYRIKKYVEQVAIEKFQELVLKRLDSHLRSFKHTVDDTVREILNKHIREQIKIVPIKEAFEEYCSSHNPYKNECYKEKIDEIEWALKQIK